MRKFDFTNGTAVITGAASGIGRSLSELIADKGSELVLVDRDEEGLSETVERIAARHPELSVHKYVADLSDLDLVEELGKEIATEHSDTHLLINNAGVALTGNFDQVTRQDFDWLMDINLNAPVILTRALLATLLSNSGAHIVNVSSVFGLVAPPGNIAYATSKFALRGFSESLRAELADRETGVTVVHPGGIRTNISRAARIGSAMTAEQVRKALRDAEAFDQMLTISPDQAAREIVDGIESRKARVVIGASATIPDILARLSPSRYHRGLSVVEALAAWIGRRQSDGAQRGGPQ